MWSKIDDGFTEHAKVAPLSAVAFRLHVSAIVHANRNLTDGMISPQALRVLLAGSVAAGKHVTELVDANLWDEVEGAVDTYAIHDFLEYNPSREKVLADRLAAAERKRRSRGVTP
jgi:hypothetical protein